jgi:hypothetical protein
MQCATMWASRASPPGWGLPARFPRLFSYVQCSLNEVKQCDAHNRLLDLAFSNSLRTNSSALFHIQ